MLNNRQQVISIKAAFRDSILENARYTKRGVLLVLFINICIRSSGRLSRSFYYIDTKPE